LGVRIEWQSNRANVNGSALFEAVTLVEVANRLEQCTAEEHGQPGCGSQSARTTHPLPEKSGMV